MGVLDGLPLVAPASAATLATAASAGVDGVGVGDVVGVICPSRPTRNDIAWKPGPEPLTIEPMAELSAL